jgi:hypothetical protein
MIPVLLKLGRALGEHARRHRDASLEVHEQGLLDAWRQTAPQLLERLVSSATTGLTATARPVQARCPRCQQRRPVQSRRKRQVQTRLGAVHIERPWHHCQPCGHGWSPSDQALGLVAHQQTSAGLARWEALLGAITTFKEAASLLAELAGVQVGAETLRVQADGSAPNWKASSARRWPTSRPRTSHRTGSMTRRRGCWWSRPTG